jgi:drug/metabolite transporter (DMT)-like permease
MGAQRSHDAGRALLIALAGFSIMSVGDAIVKSMAGEWPAPAVSALRYNFGAIGLAAAVALRYGRAGFVFPRPWLQAGRGAAVSLSTICFFLAVMAMPLADATAIQFTSPILTAIIAGLVLHEKVPRAAWLAIAVAFVGVLIVLRPNFMELGAAAFYPLGASLGMACLITFNRKSAGDAPVLVMQFVLALVAAPLLVAIAALLSLVAGPSFEIGWPSAEVVLKCATVGFTASIGHLLIYWATVHAGAATVSPMTYVQLLVAAGLGWIWFGEAPDAAAFGGAALIIGGGLLLWRAQSNAPPPHGMPD